MQEKKRLKIATLNVAHLTDVKWADITNWMRQEDINMLAMQEHKLKTQNLVSILQDQEFGLIAGPAGTGPKGGPAASMLFCLDFL